MHTETYYIVVVDTNMYSGAFERELCAYLTGQIGECGVGSHIATGESNNIKHIQWWVEHALYLDEDSDPDEHKCYRPVSIFLNPRYYNNGYGHHFLIKDYRTGPTFPAYNSVAIFVNNIPPNEVMEEFKERVAFIEKNMHTIMSNSMQSFNNKQYNHLKFEGIRIIKRTTEVCETVITDVEISSIK